MSGQFVAMAKAYRRNSYLCSLKFKQMSTMLLGIMGMGTPEIIIIAIVILLMFGGRKIPELMKGLGRGMKEFKDASNGVESKDVESKDIKTGSSKDRG